MSEEDFEPHMMYHPETGEGVMADTFEKHLELKELGYTHSVSAQEEYSYVDEDIEAGEISETVKKSLQSKVDKHNESVSSDSKKATLRALVSVFKRGVGAYHTNPGSVRPSVKSPDQWAHARVNSYLSALKSGKFSGGKHDTDLFPEGHSLSSKGKKMSASFSSEDIVFFSDAFELKAYQEDPESDDSGAVDASPKKFDITAYNGGSLSLPNFSEPAYIDISSAYIHGSEDQQPILKDHDTRKIVGHGRPVIEGSMMRVDGGVMSHDNEDTREIIAAAKKGFKWQASVGGKMTQRPLLLKEGATKRINGRSVSGPAVVVRGFMWRETSICGIGCDDERASARVAASQGAITMEFEQWLEDAGFAADDLNETQLDSLKAAFEKENTDPQEEAPAVEIEASASQEPKGESVSPVRFDPDVAASEDTRKYLDTVRAARRAEDARVSELEDVYEEYKSAVPKTVIAELFDSAIAGDLDRNKFELELIKAARQPRQSVAPRGYARRKYDPDVIEASLLRNGGMSESGVTDAVRRSVGSARVEEVMNKAYERDMQAFGLQDLVYASIESAGEEIPSRRVNSQTIEAAMLASKEIRASSASSSISLPGVLSNIANKQMLQSYEDNKGIWDKICSTTDTSDFKSFDSYRLTEAGVLEQVGPSGEIKHATLGEDSFSNRVINHARLIGLTEEMLMNDDLGAFQRLARHFGRMSAHAIEQTVIQTLTGASLNTGAGAASDFFRGAALGNSQANYFEGSSSALSIDSLGTAWQMFADQTDREGKPIMLDPAVLLTTTGNAILAKNLYNSTEVRIAGSSDRTRAVNNAWAGMFEPVMSQYLSQSAYGGSASEWYLVSRVSDDFAPIQVAFLNGQRTPQIERFDYDPNMLGVTFRAKLPFGVALQDPRCIVKSKGAA